jgi:hypothetical protein
VRPTLRHVLASAVAAGLLVVAAPAAAEGVPVRWEMSAEVVALQRFMRGADPAAPRPGVGPGAELQAHIALIPMVRVGAYVAYDGAPVPGQTWRDFVEGGLRVKWTPPILGRPWRAWLFGGVGYAWGYQSSYTRAVGAPSPEVVPGAGGGMLAVPFGVGLGLRVQSEWTVFAELGGRASLLTTGTLENEASCGCRGTFVGKDSFAAGLGLGVSWGQ